MINFFKLWIFCFNAILMVCFLPSAYAITDAELALKINNIKELESLESQNTALNELKDSSLLSSQQNASILYNIGKNHANLGQLEQASVALEKALELEISDKLRAKISRTLGIIYYHQNKPSRAITYYKNALDFYIKTDQQIIAAYIENNIALALESTGQFKLALKNYESAEPRYKEHGTEQDLLDLQINKAGLLAKMGIYDRAISFYDDIIQNQFVKLDVFTQALTLSNASVPLNSAGRHNKAVNYLEQSISLFQNLNEQYLLASAYVNLADSYIFLKNYEKAQSALVEVALIAKNLDNQRLNFYMPFYRSRIAVASNKPDVALNEIIQAIDVAKQQEDNSLLEEAYNQALIIYGVNNLIEQAQIINNALGALNNNSQEQEILEDLAKMQFNSKQNKYQLQIAELLNERQQFIFIIVVVFLILSLIFALQRRRHESKTKQQLLVLVEKRTKELKETSEDLRQASLVKSKFLANMSHEIRTPLTAIIGHSESMSNHQYDPRNFNKDIQIINNNGRHLLDLINDILDISRIEENKLELDIKPFNLTALVNEITDMFKPLATNKGIGFTVENCLNIDFAIQADSFRLKQILLNLCSNAVKFTDSGSVTLSVRETFNGVQFNVIDTGIGMEEKHLEQVFDSFSQGDSSISRRFGGSGLGLCLSEQLANLMEGSISVTSEINKGSEFILHLNVPKLTLEQQPIRKRMTTAPIFEGRVLLAEDHPDNRELITRFLVQLGLTVVAVENGLKAVEECKKSLFDIVLLDIQMPVLNGIDALKQLKENGFTKPIIAITANTMQHEISSYLEQGFFDHIKKPLDQQYFIATLSKYLNQCHKKSEISNIKVSKIIENTDLVERFIANLAKEKTHLSDLYQSQNWHELQNQLHKLRGAAAIFEFNEIESAADYFEKAIKFNDEQAYQAAYEGINFALTEHLA